MKVPAVADAVGGVREEAGSYAERVGMSAARTADLRTVVGEAFNNVVVHAYEEGGSVEIHLCRTSDDEVELVVADHGRGILPHPDCDVPSLKMGLPIIGALSASFRLESRRGHGTVLTVSMPRQ